jgi:hypothetical protein
MLGSKVRLHATRHVHGTSLLARGAPIKVSERPTRVRIPQGPSRSGKPATNHHDDQRGRSHEAGDQ